MKKFTKLLAITLALIMSLGALPFAAFAEGENALIHRVEIDIETPRPGATPQQTFVVSDDENYYVESYFYWYLNEKPYPILSATDTFESGKTYRLRLYFYAKSGFEFAPDCDYFGSSGSFGGDSTRACREYKFIVEEKNLESIRIESVPTQTTYKLGMFPSIRGLKVIAVYSDRSEVDVTDYVSISNLYTVTVGNKTATVFYNGKTATFNYTVEEAAVPTVKINNNPGTKEIKYGEGIKFTATATDLPEGAKIVWFVNDKKAGEGESLTFSDAKADATITVKIVDKDGNVMKDATDGEISESEKVTVKAGFFQKLISFFKNLFKKNRIIAQSIDSKKAY